MVSITITMASSTVILLPFSQFSDNSSTSPLFLAYTTLSGKTISLEEHETYEYISDEI